MHNSYQDRLRRVLRYIHDNPAEDLSLDRLADVAAMSRFHWHRVFHAVTGETCAEAVRRIRIERAAFMLVNKDIPIAEIAKRVGYDNIRSFNRAFREFHNMTPTVFRNEGVPGRSALRILRKEISMFDVTIRDCDDLRLAAVMHTGPYTEIGQAYDTLTGLVSAHDLWPQIKAMVGVYFDDPTSKPMAELQSCAAVSVAEAFKMPDGLSEIRLAGGRHAVCTVKGPYSGLQAGYDHMYGQWIPNSGEDLANGPPFEVYLNGPADTPPNDLVTEIYVPLKPIQPARRTG